MMLPAPPELASKASHCRRQWCAPGLVASADPLFDERMVGIHSACSGVTRPAIGKCEVSAADRIVMYCAGIDDGWSGSAGSVKFPTYVAPGSSSSTSPGLARLM